MSRAIALYVIVAVPDEITLLRLRASVARPWLEVYENEVRYWVHTPADAERERAVLALAGFRSQVELLTTE